MTSLVHSCLSSTFYLSVKVGPFNSREFTYLFKNKYSPPKNSLRELYFTWGHDFRILFISRVKTIVKVNHTTYVKLNKLQKLFNQFLRNRLDKCLPFFHDRWNCSKGACFTTLVGNTIRPELKSANYPIRFNLIGAFKKSETFLYHFWKTVSNILAQNCNNLKKIFTYNREWNYQLRNRLGNLTFSSNAGKNWLIQLVQADPHSWILQAPLLKCLSSNKIPPNKSSLVFQVRDCYLEWKSQQQPWGHLGAC